MGLLRTKVSVHHLADRGKSVTIDHVLVDTGSEATWISRRLLERVGVATEVKDRTCTMANGQQITRSIGYAVIKCDPGFQTVDEVVFAEDGDLQLLGARPLEGINATVDLTNKRLVAAGSIPAAGNVQLSDESEN